MFFKKKIVEERKERLDKKVQVAPTVHISLKREIERLAFILDQPVKKVGELLFIFGIGEMDVMNRIIPYFQRGILQIGNGYYYGHPENPHIMEWVKEDLLESDRVYIRFTQKDIKDVYLLSNLLDVSPSRAVAIILDAGIRYIPILEKLLHKYNNRRNFDYITMDELKKFMQFVNRKNPYKPKWNKVLVEFIEETKKRLLPSRKMTKEMVDRETYKWNFD